MVGRYLGVFLCQRSAGVLRKEVSTQRTWPCHTPDSPLDRAKSFHASYLGSIEVEFFKACLLQALAVIARHTCFSLVSENEPLSVPISMVFIFMDSCQHSQFNSRKARIEFRTLICCCCCCCCCCIYVVDEPARREARLQPCS
jgi:hypothetical protein